MGVTHAVVVELSDGAEIHLEPLKLPLQRAAGSWVVTRLALAGARLVR